MTLLDQLHALTEEVRAALPTLDDADLAALTQAFADARALAYREHCRRHPNKAEEAPPVHGGQVELRPWGCAGYGFLFDEVTSPDVILQPQGLRGIPIIWQHNMLLGFLGHVARWHVDDVGIWVDVLMDSAYRGWLESSIAGGDVWGWSAGFLPRQVDGVTRGMLIAEFSLVLNPADPRQLEERKHLAKTTD